MNAGAYREPVLIEKNGYTVDEIGNQVASWAEYFRGYAYMNNLSGSEYWEAAQTQSQNTVMFIFRYHPLIAKMNTREYRLVHRGEAYNITSIDNVQFKNETIKIRAVRKE
ncbi:phage head closure protein [Qiania dongpingensis]|uniref:Phage head closure protein n=1 Tax=Qiania dongpingensis TaxID=2763669 RepID=A0A7G9G6Z0_9FIRM|nr:phage head closure protein [Qiania dongpingensis]QNM06572.1 phage head closure protein [Qiania dongpingensis]